MHNMAHTSTLAFHGGTGSVTGANFLLNTGASSILVDCGLIQGDHFARKENAEMFPYDPRTIDVLFVTHAHADHIGRIPKLVKDGFKGVIYSTPPTKDLAGVMLLDAHKVMTYEAKTLGTQVLYDTKDIQDALSLWQTADYGATVTLGDNITATFQNAGHILGSAFVRLTRDGRSIVCTGDIGNVPQPLLDAPDIPTGYQYLLMESVYGDRTHEEVKERSELLLGHIKDTISAQGTLIIPAFSLERTQGMLYEINNFVESGLIDPIPTFLDSPLAISVTELYREYQSYLKESVQTQIKGGDDIFNFPKLSFTRTAKASGNIEKTPGPKIIIAGSGMSHGGRILTHEKRYLGDPNTTLLLVGYQTVGSIGRLLQDGAQKVTIQGTQMRVRARIATIRGYSGHADREALVNFVTQDSDTIEKVFVTMGEEKSSLFLVQRLRDYLGVNAMAPEQGAVETLDF